MWRASTVSYEKNVQRTDRSRKFYRSVLFDTVTRQQRPSLTKSKTATQALEFASKFNKRMQRELSRPYSDEMRAGDTPWTWRWTSVIHRIMGASRFVVGSEKYEMRESIAIPRVVLVLDVSKWQGEINFVKMKAEGVDGVIIKCGQGTAKDPYFDANWKKAKEAGLARGSYWFWDSRVSPTTQATNWWNWIKDDLGELKHYGDYEESYGGSFGGWQNFKTFMTAMVASYRADKLGIYTGYYYWIANSPNPLTNSGSLNWFGQFELWLAWYTTNPANVLIPKPWTRITLWQYGTMGVDGKTPNGARYGTQSIEVDENNFDGDEAEYIAHYGLDRTIPNPNPEPGDIMEFWAEVTTTGLNLRKGIGTSYDVILIMRLGDKVRCSGRKDSTGTWWEIIEHNGVSRTGWAYSGGSGGYMKVITSPVSNEYILHVKDGVQRKFIPEQ